MTTERRIRVMAISSGLNVGAAVAALQAANAFEVVPTQADKDQPLGLQALRDLHEKENHWLVPTGKQKAQWKRETYGRKRK